MSDDSESTATATSHSEAQKTASLVKSTFQWMTCWSSGQVLTTQWDSINHFITEAAFTRASRAYNSFQPPTDVVAKAAAEQAREVFDNAYNDALEDLWANLVQR
jgi:hypothetical protein